MSLTALSNICVVLVETTHPGNIGGVARAMKNMGLSDLRLVSPKRFPHDDAVWRAASAGEMLNTATVTETLAEAVADCGLVIGSSARDRRIPWPLLPPRQCAAQAVAEASTHKVALVFGREDRGLTNDELRACNLHVCIPSNPEYSSLNLAMAVQVISYECRVAALDNNEDISAMAEWDQPVATAEAMRQYFVHLEETLVEIGFLQPRAPKQLMTRLKRLYHRTRPDEMEMNILRGILTTTQQRLRKLAAEAAGTPDQAEND